jgi:hypothetical protein
MCSSLKIIILSEDLILWYYVLSLFIYACECIGLHNIVIMMYMLYPINDLNLNNMPFYCKNTFNHIFPIIIKL